MDKKNKRRVSMLLNSQTLYHLNQKAAEEGVDIGVVVDRMVREIQIQKKISKLQPFC